MLEHSSVIRRLRALRRLEAVERLVADGWSRCSAEDWVYRRTGPILAWLADQDPRSTPRVAKGGRLADRRSGRRRKSGLSRMRFEATWNRAG